MFRRPSPSSRAFACVALLVATVHLGHSTPRALAASEPGAATHSEKEVQFFSRDVRLSGTLTVPAGPGKWPAVVLVNESGPVDRDGSWGQGNATFRELAHHLAANGMASLRYDPRGVPKSGGNFLSAGLFDFGQDAANGANFLKTVEGLDKQKIFFVGHGYGAKAALIAASKTPDVVGVVLLAGVFEREPEHRRKIMRFQLEADSVPRAEATKILDDHKRFIDGVVTGRYVQYEDYFLDPTLADWLVQAMKVNPEIPSWWRDNIVFDPIVATARLACPVLMVQAEHDYLVDARETQQACRAVDRLGKKDCALKVLKGLGHRLTKVASRKEAYQFEKATVLAQSPTGAHPVDPSALQAITEWMSARQGGAGH